MAGSHRPEREGTAELPGCVAAREATHLSAAPASSLSPPRPIPDTRAAVDAGREGAGGVGTVFQAAATRVGRTFLPRGAPEAPGCYQPESCSTISINLESKL
mgnify:CR=1 FL=1